MNLIFGLTLSSVVAGALILPLAMLIAGLAAKRENPTELLRAAVALWISNVLVFASWY